MANLASGSYSKESIKQLLASEKIDGSGGVLYYEDVSKGTAAITPNDEDITIFIGLGGTGVQTLDYIKRKIKLKLHFSWTKRIAFLAIDADWNEIKHATSLDEDECISLKDDDFEDKIKDKKFRPVAWKHIADEAMIGSLSVADLSAPGSCGKRLVGKLKIHNKRNNEDKGIDEKIVERLRNIRAGDASVDENKRLGKLGPNGKYRVYVVGSGSGGTCSGGFLEMPTLIREAMSVDGVVGGNNLWICGMLYLPDTLELKPGVKPEDRDRLKAVGFATLKELDYYMGIPMRQKTEFFAYNNPGLNDRYHTQISGKSNFFDMMYLVGTKEGANQNSNVTAKETIAEYLISMLAQYNIKNAEKGIFLSESADSNGNGQEERETNPDAKGRLHIPEYLNPHNVPKIYSAVGFASAAAPVKLVRAYTVSQACKLAHLKSVDEADYGNGKNGELNLYPAKEYKISATEGTQRAKALLEPLERVMTEHVRNASCNLADPERCGGGKKKHDLTWTGLKENNPVTYNAQPFKDTKNNILESQTNPDAMDALRGALRDAFSEFKDKARDFVIDHGPFAFVNLYNGNFRASGEDGGLGIKQMLQNAVEGKQLDGSSYDVASIKELEDKLNDSKTEIEKASSGFGADILAMLSRTARDRLCNKWKTAEEALIKAQIIESRVAATTGEGNMLDEIFKGDADKLCTQIDAFGVLLDNMCEIYQEHGSPMIRPEKFADACDNACEVNLAALSDKSYQWIKNKADEQLKSFNAQRMREDLIKNFFKDPIAWLDIPDELIASENGKTFLKNENQAIPARKRFDLFMRSQIDFTFDLSIETLFRHTGSSAAEITQSIKQMVGKLVEESKPLFNGAMAKKNYFRSIMYPAALATVMVESSEGNKSMAQLLEEAAKSREDSKDIAFYSSADTDTIRMFQTVRYLEQYRLRELINWEKCYERFLQEHYGFHMHGYSPCKKGKENTMEISYEEPIPWKDYPTPVIYGFDPKYQPDEMDSKKLKQEREGRRQLAIRELVKKARALGLLYSAKQGGAEDSAWVIQMADANVSWKLDLNDICPDDNGYYPEGENLLAIIAGQNYRRPNNLEEPVPDEDALQEISKRVYLERSNLTTKTAPDEELAWEYAIHSMYARTDLVVRLKELIPWFEKESENVRMENDKIRASLKAGMFPALLATGKICDEGIKWTALINSKPTQVISMSSLIIKSIPAAQKKMLENDMRYAYAYSAIMKSKHMTATADLYLDLFKQAKEEYLDLWNKAMEGEEDEYNEMMSRSKPLEDEIAHVKDDLGAEFSEGQLMAGKQPCNKKFKAKLEEFGLKPDEIEEIYNFYRLADRWVELVQE